MADWRFQPLRFSAALALLLTTCVSPETYGAGINLSGQNLAHSNYSRRDLRGANLSSADLTMADFSGADLRGAELTGAKLDRINLDGADLRGVLGWAKADQGLGISANGANFSGTDLRNATVAGGYSGGYFEKADFRNADLMGSTLAGRFHGARFDGAKVQGALMLGAAGIETLAKDLSSRGAIIEGQEFATAIKSGRDFSNALLRGARLDNTDLTGAKLAAADLHSAKLDLARLNGADLCGAHFYWATALNAHFEGADLSNAHFDNVQAVGASFEGANLVGASMYWTNLSGANLRDANLTGANLSYADLTGADLTGAILDNVNVDFAIIENVHGLDPVIQQRLHGQTGRWWYDLRTGVDGFLSAWSGPLHLTLVPAAAILGLLGFRSGQARASFAVLASINIVAVIPVLVRLAFAMMGGSPTAQMSVPDLWSAWFDLWPVMMLGLFALFLASFVCGGYHVVRHVIMRPRIKPVVSLACALLTSANCFFAINVLGMMAPDA